MSVAAGAQSLWVAEHLGYREAIATCMAFALKAPGPLLVPTAVSPYLWHPTPTAMAMATLDEVAPGRAAIAIGTGNPLFLQESGHAVDKPVRANREFTEALRKLWSGEAVHMDGDFVKLAGARLAFKPSAPIPVYIAAMGPDMLRLAGRIGDGVVLSAGLSTDSVKQSIALCAEGAAKDGRDLKDFRRAGYLFFGTSRDPKEAVDAVRQKLAFVMRNKFLAANIKASGIAVDQEAVMAAIARRDIAARGRARARRGGRSLRHRGHATALQQEVARLHRCRDQRAGARPPGQHGKLPARARRDAGIRRIAAGPSACGLGPGARLVLHGNCFMLRRRFGAGSTEHRRRPEMKRRALLTLAAGSLAAAAIVATAPGLSAQTFPSEPITFIVAWPAGGGSDISMRLLADALSKQVKVPVAVLNKPGAGGAIGHREIVNAKPDGYTIGMFSSGGIALPYMNAQANTIDEMQPIAFFGEDPNALQVSIASGIGSLKEYVERARANPGKLKNGNDQPGGSSYIAVALYEKQLDIKVTRVALWRLCADRDRADGRRGRFRHRSDPGYDRAAQGGQAQDHRRLGDRASLHGARRSDLPRAGLRRRGRLVALHHRAEGHAGRPPAYPGDQPDRRDEGSGIPGQGEEGGLHRAAGRPQGDPTSAGSPTTRRSIRSCSKPGW